MPDTHGKWHIFIIKTAKSIFFFSEISCTYIVEAKASHLCVSAVWTWLYLIIWRDEYQWGIPNEHMIKKHNTYGTVSLNKDK